MLVGEAEYRQLRGITQLIEPVFRHLFETLAVEAVDCTLLSHNRATILILEKLGWTMTERFARAKKNLDTGETYDVLAYELSRDAWLRQRQISA